MEIIALNCPNPADIGAKPAYEANPPMPVEVEGRSSLRHQLQPADLGAQPRKFGRLAAGLSGSAERENGEKAKRGRRRKYKVEDLVECLGEAKLSTSEFRMAANKQCGMSRAMFYRLLKKGRKELRFRQHDDTCGPWEAVRCFPSC